MGKFGFGMLGCGTAALPVAEALAGSATTRLAKVYDVNPTMAQDLAERFQVPVAADLDALLNDPNVQAIYVAVPHYLLHSLARRVLEAGKPALVEKPLALTLAEADDLIALAESQQLALGVFYELRHTHAHTQAKAIVEAGAIGQVIGVRIQTLIDKALSYWQVGYAGRSNNPWRGQKARAGGGVVLMNTSHQLDAFHYVTGLEVSSVAAEVATLVAEVEVEDTASLTLRYNNGALGSVMSGAHIVGAANDHVTEIYGTQGQLKLPDPYSHDPLQVYIRQGWNDIPAAGVIPANTWHSLATEPVNTFAKSVEAFAWAVENCQPAPTSGRDARRILQIVLAAYQSAAEKRTITIY